MKENHGHFKQKSEPTIIGDKYKDEPDVAELIDNFRAKNENEEDSDDENVEEDNQEGMGDIDVNANNYDEADEDDEEEDKDNVEGKEEKKE